MRYSTLSTPSKLTALAAASALALASAATAQIRYQLVVPKILGNPINQVSAQSNEINENGETLLNRISTFAVWRDGTITHIASGQSDYPASFSSINATSINRFQQVVGSKTYLLRDEEGTRFDTFPFYWDPSNGIVDLDELGQRSENGSGTTRLYQINEEGLAVGTTQLFEGNEKAGNQAFTWSFQNGRTEIAPLHSFGNYSVTTPHGLNSLGTVVGTFRQFGSSTESYYEHGFIFDSANGSQDLKDLAPAFFQSDHYTARDINDAGNFVGERDQAGYLYNAEEKTGYSIASPDGSQRATRAYALNNHEVVAGTTQNASSPQGYSPIIWTRSTGTIELLPQIEKALQSILPSDVTPADCKITPKAINGRAQISASLETQTTFSREVILKPVLDFHWNSKRAKSEGGIQGVLYSHDKTQLEGSIPAAPLGYEIAFECSSDMQHWSPISPDNDGIRHLETESTIELFVPFSECIFVRPVLKSIQSEANSSF